MKYMVYELYPYKTHIEKSICNCIWKYRFWGFLVFCRFTRKLSVLRGFFRCERVHWKPSLCKAAEPSPAHWSGPALRSSLHTWMALASWVLQVRRLRSPTATHFCSRHLTSVLTKPMHASWLVLVIMSSD